MITEETGHARIMQKLNEAIKYAHKSKTIIPPIEINEEKSTPSETWINTFFHDGCVDCVVIHEGAFPSVATQWMLAGALLSECAVNGVEFRHSYSDLLDSFVVRIRDVLCVHEFFLDAVLDAYIQFKQSEVRND